MKKKKKVNDGQRLHVYVDQHTLDVIDEIKNGFGVNTRMAVFRRSLALARFALENASNDHTITIIDKNGEKVKVLLT